MGREQPRGGLLTDPGDAGQAVGRVPAHRGEVRVLAGEHAVLRDDRRVGQHLEVAHPACGVDDAHIVLVIDELEEIAVTCHDVDRHARSCRESADDVICLVFGGADDLDAERVEHFTDDGHLHLEGVGHDLDIGA